MRNYLGKHRATESTVKEVAVIYLYVYNTYYEIMFIQMFVPLKKHLIGVLLNLNRKILKLQLLYAIMRCHFLLVVHF